MPPDFLSDFIFVLFLVVFYFIALNPPKPNHTKFDFIFLYPYFDKTTALKPNISFNITNKFQITPSFKLIL